MSHAAAMRAMLRESPLEPDDASRIARVFARAGRYGRKRFAEIFERYDEPLKGALEQALHMPKLANMTRDGAASRILAAASIDLAPPEELVLELGWVMQLGNAHMLLVDEIVDNKFDHDPARADLVPVADAFWLEFIFGMQRICGPDAGLTERIGRDYRHAFNAICFEERRHVDRIEPYGEPDFVQIERKCSPIKLVFYPILRQQGRLEQEKRIGRCIDLFVQSCLFLDDYRDWREDLLNRRFTWPLTLGLARLGIDNARQLPEPDAEFLARLEAAMVASDVGLRVYQRSLGALDSARAAADGVLPTVARMMQQRLDEIQGGLKDLIRAQCQRLPRVA